MKATKRITTLILAICLAVSCFSMVSFAANQIQFEDPTTAVGEVLQFKGVIKSDKAIEDRTIVMTYDTSMLKFKSGDNITETEPGKLTYDLKGQRGEQRVEFPMSFDVLKEGTTKVEVASYEIFATTNEKLTYTAGFSTITIAAGTVAPVTTEEPTEETTGTTVEIDDDSYVISEDFEESDIPEGFEESILEYAGKEYKVVAQEETGLYLVYLVNDKSEGKFFLYVQENATFAPFAQITISETTTIVLLSYVEDIVFPDSYIETKVEIENEGSFPAWQSSENKDVCVFYAINNHGQKSLYQYDKEENTYQRFQMPEVEEEKEDTSFIGKLSTILGEHLDWVVLGVGVGLILFLIIVIILGVKLHNRNAELDELYDEYGIDLLDDGEENNKKDSRVIRLDDEDDYEEIDYGTDDDMEEIDYSTEDDIVIAGLEAIEAEKEEELLPTEEPQEAQVAEEPDFVDELETLLPKDIAVEEEDVSASIRTVAEAVKLDEDYWSDDDNDFEINFIDLDD